MSKIDDMIDNVLKHEGGFVNKKADKGGPTNLGITQATLSSYLGRQASIQDVKSITKDTAAKIYKTNYYNKPRINELPELVQPIIFDIAVNSGPKKAIKMLQECLTNQGYSLGAIDGLIGGATLKAANAAASSLGVGLVNLMVNRRISFYKGIVQQDPSQQIFLKGWLARAESFRVDDTDMA